VHGNVLTRDRELAIYERDVAFVAVPWFAGFILLVSWDPSSAASSSVRMGRR